MIFLAMQQYPTVYVCVLNLERHVLFISIEFVSPIDLFIFKWLISLQCDRYVLCYHKVYEKYKIWQTGRVFSIMDFLLKVTETIKLYE